MNPAGPLTVWPDPEVLTRAWLVAGLAGVNVATQTDATFGTSTPNAWMALPLVLVEAVPGGGADLYSATAELVVDVSSFAPTKTAARTLAQQAHSRMLTIVGENTGKGYVDEISVDSMSASLNYSNPDVSRFIATYTLAARPLR